MSCENGLHNLIEIYRNGYCDHENDVVRWCETCGAIVVDIDYDNRTHPGKIMKLKLPKNRG